MNPNDSLILLSAASAFFVFLVLQVIVFRRLPPPNVLSGIVKVFLVSAVFAYAFFIGIGIRFLALSFVLYALMSLIYILALFGIVESSVRIRLLREIAGEGKKGIPARKLLERYNKEIILKKRLQRFLASGDIVKEGNRYRLQKNVSAFSLPGFLFSLIWKLYR